MPFANLPHAHSNMKPLTQVLAQFVNELRGARRKQIYILCHARLRDVGIDRLSAKHDDIITVAQKFKNHLMDRDQRQWLIHHKLLKGQNVRFKHQRSPEVYDEC